MFQNKHSRLSNTQPQNLLRFSNLKRKPKAESKVWEAWSYVWIITRRSAVCFSNQIQFFFGLTFVFCNQFLCFMLVTPRHLQHGKYQCKFEKDWHSVIRKVKTLAANKDKNVPAFFSISIKHRSKIERET